ncbi:MAG TPA: NIPSNAP family protein [Vicinamibacterales bacterium]|nr:NIPSNAP family protein [Vicinamibacterales bacterium]
MKRREFLRSATLAGGAVMAGGAARAGATEGDGREFYELRVYETNLGARKRVLDDYLERAFIPALNRAGSSPVGAFNVIAGASSLALYLLVPFPTLDALVSAPARLAADPEYVKAAEPCLSAPIDDPAYVRYESSLLRAFAEAPRVRVPAETAAKQPRLFELRTYESHSERAALRKIEMFNEGGEIALFDRLGLRSVFFGQTLMGRRQPNLVYMTVHRDQAARDRSWAEFSASPDWKRLSSDPAFANTVSAQHIVFLRPAAYSQI